MEDRMSMACSIESRLPFLDYRLIELTFNLPDRLKLHDGVSKVVLREAMKHRLPASIVAQGRKKRFSSPYGQWLRQEWRPLVEDTLLGTCKLQSYIDMDSFQRRLRLFLGGDGKALEVETIWRAFNTELFLRNFSQADANASTDRESVSVG
jgi:asparagine synthase (glutamine-hydrolysing)